MISCGPAWAQRWSIFCLASKVFVPSQTCCSPESVPRPRSFRSQSSCVSEFPTSPHFCVVDPNYCNHSLQVILTLNNSSFSHGGMILGRFWWFVELETVISSNSHVEMDSEVTPVDHMFATFSGSSAENCGFFIKLSPENKGSARIPRNFQWCSGPHRLGPRGGKTRKG